MKKIYLILFIGILFGACSRDEMDRTIFIPDEKDNKLPAYTEWGYNSFGAEYERDYFLASNEIVPCKIMYKDNKLHFYLSGVIRDGKEMTLIFSFPLNKINEISDLLQLNNQKINLSNEDCTVSVFQYNNEIVLDVINGELYFKRAQLLNIDDEINRVILSGVFELRFLQNGFPSTISNGRFDLGITKNVFYSY